MVSTTILIVVVMTICILLGGIGIGIYVWNFNSKPENKNKKYSITAIVLIMITAILTGMFICAIIYLIKEQETCEWGKEDIAALKRAQTIIDLANEKVKRIPRDMAYVTHCEAGEEGCGVKVTPNVTIQKTEPRVKTEGKLSGVAETDSSKMSKMIDDLNRKSERQFSAISEMFDKIKQSEAQMPKMVEAAVSKAKTGTTEQKSEALKARVPGFGFEFGN